MTQSPDPAVRSDTEVLHTLVDNISAMLAYWDSERRCRFANRAYERWFGVTPESLIGRHISELLGPLYQLNLPYIEGALRGEPQQFEREIPDPAGGPSRHSLASYTPDIVDGVVRGFCVLVTDISEIKRTELALAQSEAKFSKIVALSADAMIAVDETQRITMFNEGAESTFGYSKAEIIGLPLDVLIPERFRVLHRQHVEQFARGNETARRAGGRKVVGLRKNGQEFPAEASIAKLEVRDGLVLTVSLRDVSEQRRVEDEERLLAKLGKTLVAAGSDYQRLLTDVATVIANTVADWCTVDIVQEGEVRRLRVLHADPAMAAVCEALERYPVRRAEPGPIAQVVDSQRSVLVSEVSPEYLESVAQNAEHLGLIRALDPGSFIVVPLVARGQTLGTLGLGASRASRRYGMQDLRLAERLATRVALAVDNARLHEALERAIRARDEVLGIVAHDLRNPLNAIVLHSQLLGRQAGDPQRQDLSVQQSIHRAATRMNRLIQDLLDVTRLEGGARLSLRPAAVPAASLVTEALELHAAAISTSKRHLQIEVPAELPDVWADRARMLQVLDNLLGNALKFSRKRISAGASRQGGEVMFWIADDGTGVPKEDLPHLFDRFWQATSTDRRGAGLGLSIVKGIVDSHGGRVWVDSKVGEGTTFYFTLPVAPVAK